MLRLYRTTLTAGAFLLTMTTMTLVAMPNTAHADHRDVAQVVGGIVALGIIADAIDNDHHHAHPHGHVHHPRYLHHLRHPHVHPAPRARRVVRRHARWHRRH